MSDIKNSNKWLPGFIITGIVWGSSFLFIKVALEGFSVLQVGLLRQLLGAISLLAFALATRAVLPKGRQMWGRLAVLAMLHNAVPGLLFAWGETLLPSALAGIINATTPLMTTLAMLLIFKSERITVSQGIGLLLGFFGVVVLSGQLVSNEPVDFRGVLILLAATACYGLGFPFARKYLSNTGASATALATGQVTCAAVLLLPIFAINPDFTAAVEHPEAILSIAALGIIGTGFAYILNFRTMALAGSAIASTVTYISPVVAVLVGWLVLGEPIHWYVALGAAIILLSAALVQQRIKLPGKKAS